MADRKRRQLTLSTVWAPRNAGERDCFSGIERHSSQWDPLIRQKIYRACMTIEQEYNRRLPGWQQQIVGQLMLMASDVIREVPKAALSATVQRDDSLRRVLGYLSEHFLEPVTLRDCAAALGFKPVLPVGHVCTAYRRAFSSLPAQSAFEKGRVAAGVRGTAGFRGCA